MPKSDNQRCNIKINLLRIMLVILIIIWMGVIFGFSSKEGPQSQSLSDGITGNLVRLIYMDYGERTTEQQRHIWNDISFAVRKTAHFGEYAILAVLVTSFILTFSRIKKVKRFYKVITLICICYCAVYAMTDEFHQSFVGGRSPKFMDVCIDILGGTSGAMFMLLIYSIIMKFRVAVEEKS